MFPAKYPESEALTHGSVRSIVCMLRSRRALMRPPRVGWGISVCALLSAVYGVADAQTTKNDPAADTSVGMQRQVNLSPQEQLAQADAFVARMGVTGASVRR